MTRSDCCPLDLQFKLLASSWHDLIDRTLVATAIDRLLATISIARQPVDFPMATLCQPCSGWRRSEDLPVKLSTVTVTPTVL